MGRIAPVVRERLTVPPTRTPKLVVVPSERLGDGVEGAYKGDRIYVAASSELSLVEIVAHELTHSWIHFHYPSVPHLIEEGVALVIGAEVAGTTDNRMLDALMDVRVEPRFPWSVDLAEQRLHATIPVRGSLSVPGDVDYKKLSALTKAEQRLLTARAFLAVRALMADDLATSDDLIPSLVRRLTPGLLTRINDPCTCSTVLRHAFGREAD